MTLSTTRILVLLLLLPPFAALSSRAAAAQGIGRMLEGRVIAADGADTREVRVRVQAGVIADSADVGEQGRFAVKVPDGADSVTLLVDAATGARSFHSARVELGPAELRREQEIILLPRAWTITAGTYAGETVEIDIARAFEKPCATCSGFYRRSPLRVDSARTIVAEWPAERFPLRVAFDREWSGVNVSVRDSVVFWSQVQEMEDAFGADIFRPATFAEAAPHDNGPNDVILVWFDPELKGLVGLGSAISNNAAEIEYGDLRLDRAALSSRDAVPGLVAHELMHTLGFGHTCAWRTVLADVRRCPELVAPVPTPEDVAYVQLAARVRALQRERRGRWALEAALAAKEPARATVASPGTWTSGSQPERSGHPVAGGAGDRL
ncbi:MAG TPA: hypothetical protein VF771_10870 [Longimicrobiaceae bacterium]